MRLLRGAFLVLLALFLVYPLARLLVMPLVGGGGFAWRPLLDSAGLAVLTGLLAAPLGAALAQALETRSGRVVGALALGLWILFIMPGYVLTTGWLVVFSHPAMRASLFGNLFLGPAGLLFLYLLKALPFAVFVARATYANIGASLHEAALVLRLPRWRRLGLSVRLALPAMAAGFAIAAIETMQDFSIPATLGITGQVPVLTYSIYQRLNTTPADFAGAAQLCWWLIGGAVLFSMLQVAVQRRYRAVLVHGKARRGQRPRPGAPERAALALAALLLWGLGLACPLLAIADVALWGGLGEADLFSAIPRSLGYGALAASLTLGLAVALLKLQRGQHPLFAGLLQAVLSANMAVPGLVLGAGYVVAFNNDLFPLYGTVLLLIIAYAAGVLPMAMRLVGGAMAQIDTKLNEAARIFALPVQTRLIDIEAALLARPALHAWLLVVAAVMFELPVSELLYVPGQMPLSVAIVAADMGGHYNTAAQLALLGVGVLALLALGLNLALRLGQGAQMTGREAA